MDIKTTENMKEKASKYLEAFVLYDGKSDLDAVVERADRHTRLIEACMEDNRILYCVGELPELKIRVAAITDNLDKTIGLPADGDFDPSRFSAKLAAKLTEALLKWNRERWSMPYRESVAHAIHDLANMPMDSIKRRDACQTWPHVFNAYSEMFKRAHVNQHMLEDLATKYLAYSASRICSAEAPEKATNRLYNHWRTLLNVYTAVYRGYITPGALSNAEWLCGCLCPGILVPTDEYINVDGHDLYCPFDVAQALTYPVVDCQHSDLRDITNDILIKIKQGD